MNGVLSFSLQRYEKFVKLQNFLSYFLCLYKYAYKITKKIANMQEDSVFYAKKVKKSEKFNEKRD